MTELSKITKVKPREVWPHEAHDFTKWLATDENISRLSDVIGIQFENVKVESAAGRYFVDIVADVADGGGKIVIENQLEVTNHKHLGQLITYASALEANFIFWVVTDFKEEHKQAIDWLNRSISDRINFFLIQVEVIKIDDSRPAPVFNVICEPNNWTRVIQSAASGNEVSDTKLLQMEYWEQLIECARQSSTSLSFGSRARPQHWYNLGIGTSRAQIVLTLNTRTKKLGCEMYIHEDKELFDLFFDKKNEIEVAIEQELNWMRRDDGKSSGVLVTMDGDVKDKSSWNELNEWCLNISEKFAKVFGGYL